MNERIFVLWLQGKEKMPELVRLCLESVYRNANNHEVVFLSRKNLHEWVDPLPSRIKEKFNKGIFPKQLIADYTRLACLEKYGGLWLDATVYVSSPITDNVFNNPFFTIIRKESNDKDITGKISTFVMGRAVSNKNSQRMFAFTKDMMINYFLKEDDLINYLLLENIMNIAINKDQMLNDLLKKYYKDKKNVLGLERILNKEYDSSELSTLLSENIFNKLNFHVKHLRKISNGKLTNYGYLVKNLGDNFG